MITGRMVRKRDSCFNDPSTFVLSFSSWRRWTIAIVWILLRLTILAVAIVVVLVSLGGSGESVLFRAEQLLPAGNGATIAVVYS